MIKVISFDIGGTLIKDIKTSNEQPKYDIYSLAILVNKPYEEVRKSYKNIFQKKKGTLTDLTKIFCDSLNIQITDELIDFFNNKFKSDTIGKVSKLDLQLIKDLKKEGYVVILFSNACCLLHNNLENDVLQYVDDVFYSYDLGYTKNEEKSYRIIEKKLGYKPNEFLHIGDNLKSDYISPKKFGWNALYYTNKKDNEYEHISNLKDVYSILN